MDVRERDLDGACACVYLVARFPFVCFGALGSVRLLCDGARMVCGGVTCVSHPSATQNTQTSSTSTGASATSTSSAPRGACSLDRLHVISCTYTGHWPRPKNGHTTPHTATHPFHAYNIHIYIDTYPITHPPTYIQSPTRPPTYPIHPTTTTHVHKTPQPPRLRLCGLR